MGRLTAAWQTAARSLAREIFVAAIALRTVKTVLTTSS
jgi:hypothetical protein